MLLFRLATFAAALLLPICAQASSLVQTINRLEERLHARIGLAIHDSRTGERWGHRENERFLMNSIVKVPLCAAILAREASILSEELPIRAGDILGHAPVTEQHVGSSMAISDLCLAAIDQSDNTTANLLFDRLGGPESLTTFLREIGDNVSRSDRLEPELNIPFPNNSLDTTTPTAMVLTLEEVLTGDTLTRDARALLAQWMQPGGVTGALLRPSVPDGWNVADKSGGGDSTRNLIAMVTPPEGEPIFISLFISDTDADFAMRNVALNELAAVTMQMLIDGL